jgi:hypothetical protein
VVLPTHAIRDEAVQRPSIGAPKESLATAPDEVRLQGSGNARQFAPRQKRKRLLYQWLNCWRRGWDSNPRYGYPYNGFRDRYLKLGLGPGAKCILGGYGSLIWTYFRASRVY